MDTAKKISLITVLVLITVVLFLNSEFLWIIPLVLIVIILSKSSISTAGGQNNNSVSIALRAVNSFLISSLITGLLMMAYGYFYTGDNLGGLVLMGLVPIFFPIVFLLSRKFSFRLSLILFVLLLLPVIAFLVWFSWPILGSSNSNVVE